MYEVYGHMQTGFIRDQYIRKPTFSYYFLVKAFHIELHYEMIYERDKRIFYLWPHVSDLCYGQNGCKSELPTTF
jgi:hypothetical protein